MERSDLRVKEGGSGVTYSDGVTLEQVRPVSDAELVSIGYLPVDGIERLDLACANCGLPDCENSRLGYWIPLAAIDGEDT